MTGTSQKWLKFRIVTLLCFFLVLFTALISRAFQLQVLSGKILKNLADRQHTRMLQIPSERGVIFDRNGEKLAVSVVADSVCADPSSIANPDWAAGQIAPILNEDKKTIRQKLSGSRNFCWLARRIPPEQAARIEALNIDGIFIIKEAKRFYPNGELAGHLLGFVGLDSTGLEGLEKGYEEFIKGTPEKLVWSRDAKGKSIYPRIEKAAVTTRKEEGYHLILTIDSRIQNLVETQLKEAIIDKGAKSAFAIVMDPKTGEILAMADAPEFDPNNFSSYAIGQGKNKAIADCFDPGSIFKPFVAAGALQEGIAKETDRFYCENGAYMVADRIIHEAQKKKHGTLTFSEIIKYSSNIGAAKIGEKLGKEKMHDYITRFGFGAKTGIDLPGESPGLLRPQQNWSRVDTVTIAFGQGVSVTAIQMITALSAIANQGVLMKPHVVKGLVNRQGQIVKVVTPTVVRRVISPKTAKKMTSILTSVVQADDGTGKRARIENVNVGGKTGTAQKLDPLRHVYSSEQVRTSFMGFFPSEDPQLVMLITLDEPQRDKWGGLAAAPIFKKIGEQILTRFNTNIREIPTLPLEVEKGGGIMTVKYEPEGNDTGGRSISKEQDNESVMPDFRGMTVREALKRAQERGIALTMKGSGWALSQEPTPGSLLADRAACTVAFSTDY